ncbi:hypothetical protein C8255_19785 [filamentous cyanobacterium CCP3]|nr:hypothetical protein C8255_19785 [filamentous cyanobacterium CCP3]
MTYPQGPDLVKRLTRIENQLEALRRAEIVILQELTSLYHRETITEHSVQLLLAQLEALKSIRPKKNGDRP